MAFVARVYAGGWLAVARTGDEREIRLRLADNANGRLAIVELWLLGPAGLTGSSLRDLPLGQWEAKLNSPTIAADIRERIGDKGPSLEEVHEFRETLAPAVLPAVVEHVGALDRDLVVIFPAGSPRVGAWQVEERRPVAAPQLKLQIPKGGKRPDDFYGRVAEAYSWLAGRSRHPAGDLARENSVPDTTVHRWVKEARRRGLLGAGRRKQTGVEE